MVIGMKEQFERTALLLGEEAVSSLADKTVAVFGIGGVGGYAAEALARSGIGSLVLVDDDKVCLSNINRQIIALHSTVGQYKTEVMRRRILDINPACEVRIHNCFYLPDTRETFDFTEYDYVVDAVDTVTAKLDIIVRAGELGIPVISSMGAGNKLHPAMFEVADIYKTSVCPLAKVMRRELKKRGVKACKVVYSKEEALTPKEPVWTKEEENQTKEEILKPGQGRGGKPKRQSPGSIAFVPSVAGLILAGEVINDLLSRIDNR